MPFVRYARDRRGYETLYVMHAFEGDGKAPRPRVLYACRTVPYAKVGRLTIDEPVQRRIEAAYPALVFEWPKLLKEAAASAPRAQTPERNEKERGRRKSKKSEKGKGSEQSKKSEGSKPGRRSENVKPADAPAPRRSGYAEEEAAAALRAQQIPSEPTASSEQPASPAPSVTSAPSVTPAPSVTSAPPAPSAPTLEPSNLVLEAPSSWPATAALGAGRTLIFRGRFIELATKVQSRVDDPAEQRRLLAEVWRLNPEGWGSAEEALAGAEAFEALYAQVAAELRRG